MSDPIYMLTTSFGRSRKRVVFLVIALTLLGWFAYNNVSLPSDWVLYKTLLREVEKHPGKTIRLKIKDIYPGSWQKVCFYGSYQRRADILRRVRIPRHSATQSTVIRPPAP